MNRTASLAISLESHTRKVPYEGRTRYVIGHTALLEKRTDRMRVSSVRKIEKTQQAYDNMVTDYGRSGR